jgi:polysaccharide biosynthesis/export protein PslD
MIDKNRRNLSQILSVFTVTAVLGSAFGTLARPHKTATDLKPPPAPPIQFSQWQDDDPYYLFFPGDKIEVQIPSAPELNRVTQIGQDGRITLPHIGQVMAAFKSVPELSVDISEKYRQHLRHPDATVFPVESANTRVLVGGQVRNPGFVEAPGDFDALSAVMAAGGLINGARSNRAVIIRRGQNGEMMQTVIDLKSPLKGRATQLVALRRYDIVFVPKTKIAEAGVWVEQNINNLVPPVIANYLLFDRN